MHGKQVGFMPTKALEGKIAAKQVIIAEEGVKRRGVQGASKKQLLLAPATGRTPSATASDRINTSSAMMSASSIR
jgi:hypothetical protein